MINTVKQQENGWLVNGNMSVPDDKGNRHYIEVQKWIANGGVVEPQYTLNDLKNQKKQELMESYDKDIYSDIEYMNTTFQADKYSQSIMAQNLSIGMVPDDFYWKDKANNKVSLTFIELQGLGAEIQKRSMISFDKLNKLKTTLETSESIADIENIKW